MRRSSVFYSTALTTAFIGAIWGCGDLLHSTEFTEKSTFIPEELNFCKWNLGEAQEHAIHACTMLLSCQHGFSTDAPNAYGECIKRAILAYSCEAAPSRPVKGNAREFWSCLWRAQTCQADDPAKLNDVASCFRTEDGGTPRSLCADAAGFVSCEGPLRAECRDQNTIGNFDPCVASGRTCTAVGTSRVCSVSNNGGCTKTGCEGTRLHWCVTDAGPTQDRGVDCANYGAQACDISEAGTPVCRPSVPPLPDGAPPPPDASVGPTCTAGPGIRCEGEGFAVGCPSGVEERVNCNALGLNCNPAPGGDPFDVSRACGNPNEVCVDTCVGNDVQVCLRGGLKRLIDCAAHGLGPCSELKSAADGKTQATCGEPLPRR